MAEYTSYWSSPFENQAKHVPTLPLPEIGVPSQITLFSQPHADDVHYVYETKKKMKALLKTTFTMLLAALYGREMNCFNLNILLKTGAW